MTELESKSSKNNKDNAIDIMDINAMPAKTWYWLGVNSAELSWSKNGESLLGEKAFTLNAGRKYEDVIISYSDIKSEFNHDRIVINAAEGSEMTLITRLDMSYNMRLYFDIKIGKNAKLKLIELCKVGDNTIYSDIDTTCDEGGEFELIHMFTGMKRLKDDKKEGKIYSNVKVDLVGDKSDFRYDMGYLAQGNDIFDYNIIVNHIGKKTNCEITANGALRDSAHKIFRGTIDFKTGSSDSTGAETETVLLLGDDVVNKTVPVILCSEENVSGTHGASIGELDEETLFYFESRGIDKAVAEDIMARASIERLSGLIENEKVKEIIEDILKDVLGK